MVKGNNDIFILQFLISDLKVKKTYDIVVKALWNALRGRHTYGSTSGNQKCRAALLNDNAPDSELSDMSSSPLRSSNFCSLQYHLVCIGLFLKSLIGALQTQFTKELGAEISLLLLQVNFYLMI